MSFNKNTSIDWPGLTHTWNPVIGCTRGCEYCYARDLHQKRHKAYLKGKLQACKQYAKPFSEIQYFPERLRQRPPKAAKRVFVGDLTDIEFWPLYAVLDVVYHCWKYPSVEFMFLSKNPDSYTRIGWDWPPNTLQGLTMTCEQDETEQRRLIARMCYYPRPYLSIEPLLGNLKVAVPLLFEHVIAGKLNHRGAKLPEREWCDSISRNTLPEQIYWKNGRPWGGPKVSIL